MKSEKLDKQIRTRLERRRITPSDAAWDRLEQQLDSDQRERKSRRLLYYAAASVVIGVFFTVSFLRQEQAMPTDQPVVQEEVSLPELLDAPDEDAVIPEVKAHQEVAVAPVEERIAHTSVTPAESVQEEFVVDHNLVEKREVTELVLIPVDHDLSFEQNTLAKTETAHPVSDAEIDALLAGAEAALAQSGPSETSKVNAAMLLEDVEDELDQSFKDKALHALKIQFVKLRSAVAEKHE